MKTSTPRIAVILFLFAAANCAAAGSYVPPAQFNVSTIGFKVNGIAYNSASNEILAALPSSDGVGLGNTLTTLSNTGAVLHSTYVGSEPTTIGLSSDGATAYVGMAGASIIRQYDVASRTAGSQIYLGSSSYDGPNYARQILVSPTDNSTIAVALRNQCCSPSSEGVAVYSNGVAAPNRLSSYQADVTSMAYASGSTVYGFNGDSSGFNLYKMSVDSNGVSLLSNTPDGLGSAGYYSTITSSGGLIYSSNGAVFDPAVGYVIGTYNSPLPYTSLVAVDPVSALGVVFAIDSHGNLVIFDQDTFTPISSYDLGSISASYYGGASLLHLNNGSLAFLSGNKDLYIVNAVPEPPAYALFLAGLGTLGISAYRRRKRG